VTSDPGDYRSPGQHDVDRVLYSSAYRRLTGVTQVVAVGERQLFHNRLAHTQKVAQLSRRVAQFLNANPANKLGLAELEGGRIDEDCAEAAGLAHDLGHPPFGHIAEKALDRKCKNSGVDGYEGNAQSLRIVSKLSVRRDEQNLELSDRTLNGILKYPWMSDFENPPTKDKWGAYLSERDVFERVRGAESADTSQSIEAAIMDWADDISYAVHDLEDFYRAGFVNLYGMQTSGVLRTEFFGRAYTEWNGDPWPEEQAREDFDAIFLRIKTVDGAFDGSLKSRATVSELGSSLINLLVNSTSLTAEGKLAIEPTLKRQVHFLKQLTWQFVINEPSLATLQVGEVKVIDDLFDSLTDWIATEKRKQRLPTRLKDLQLLAMDESYNTKEARDARTVADYISSLTEDQAMDLHARLHGYTRGSVQDTWVSY
jgi:dGTPase